MESIGYGRSRFRTASPKPSFAQNQGRAEARPEFLPLDPSHPALAAFLLAVAAVRTKFRILLVRLRVDDFFNEIASRRTLSLESYRQLLEQGCMIVPDALPPNKLAELAAAYDGVMAECSSEPEFKTSSTTTRLFDLVNRGEAFNQIYIHSLLLEACIHVIGEPFKLSSLLARTLNARTPAQDLHSDLPRGSADAPMVGFILMIDSFTGENGSTRFVPYSHMWPDLPADRMSDLRSDWQGQVLACGKGGSMIVFNGTVWHGHTANQTFQPHRSVQGYFVRRGARSGLNFSDRMIPDTVARISPLAKYLLML